MLSPSRSAAFEVLMRVEQGAFADELLHSKRVDDLSPSDRALCTEIVMGVLRWRSQLDASIARFSKAPPDRLDCEVRTALRIGAYQLLYLDRVPSHAAVDQAVELVKRSGRRFSAPMVNAVMRRIAEHPHPPQDDADSLAKLAEVTAHPLWLLERWLDEYGLEVVKQVANYDQRIPTPAVRLSDAAAEQELQQEGIELVPGALVARARRITSGDVTKTRIFAEGRAYLQDEASQLIALLVGRGARILDCCAAPGGKTSAMAQLNPCSLVIATELHPSRARLMHRLVQAQNVRVIAADANALPLNASFDRVLADVPCSGTGTLARNPEIKWRLRPEDLPDLHDRRTSILRSAMSYVAPGGRLVYSTCSLEREENEEVVAEAMTARADFRLLDCRDELRRLKSAGELLWDDLDSLVRGKFLRTLPGTHPCDGFFAAIFEKNAGG
jgi:16S rRNA (cytosine967-C5)-methyltransferase